MSDPIDSKQVKNEIALILITGFLGAGKTTFLRCLAGYAQKLGPIAVIVNEFAELPVDGAILKLDGIDVMELANGSIFCGCLKPDFIRALLEMAKRPVRFVLVEGSGLADPSGIRQITEQAGAMAARPLVYQGSICLVDGTNFLDLADTLVAVESQVAGSSCVLLNKIDLLREEEIQRVEQKIREFSPLAKVFRTAYAEADVPGLLNAVRQTGHEAESSNTPESRPAAYVLNSSQPVTKQGLERFLAEAAPASPRIKGFLEGVEGLLYVSAVQNRFEVTLWKPDSSVAPGLAVISRDNRDLGPALRKAWREHVDTPLTMKAAGLPFALPLMQHIRQE